MNKAETRQILRQRFAIGENERPMEEPIPLGPEDRAILELECATVAGHTCKVVRLGSEPPDVEQLRARVRERISLTPALTRRLGGTPQAPAWVTDECFDVADHVTAASVDGPVDHAGLLALVARLFEQRLDRSRPLWRMEMAELADGGSVIVWLIHHSLADGTASMRYGRALLWDDGPETTMTPAQAAAGHAVDEVRRRAHLASFLRREYTGSERRSPFDGTVGRRREVAFAAVSLLDLHEAANEAHGNGPHDRQARAAGVGRRLAHPVREQWILGCRGAQPGDRLAT
jgi:diacylglycerol O-acyltransferase